MSGIKAYRFTWQQTQLQPKPGQEGKRVPVSVRQPIEGSGVTEVEFAYSLKEARDQWHIRAFVALGMHRGSGKHVCLLRMEPVTWDTNLGDWRAFNHTDL